MNVFGMIKAFNALNSDDLSDLVEYATDYLKDLTDEQILSESFQQTVAVAENLLTYMKQRVENAKARNRNTGDSNEGGNRESEKASQEIGEESQ